MASPLNLTVSARSRTSTDANGNRTITGSGTDNSQEFEYTTKDGAYYNSIYDITGQEKLAFFPSALKEGTDQEVAASRLGTIHSDDTNDTSILSLIEYTSRYPAMTLKASNFAYLKNVGVYSNNRLIIARRFNQPVSDDLTTYTGKPFATLISWVPEDTDFLEVKYGEKWVESEADFTSILNEIGKDFEIGKESKSGMGTMIGGGLSGIPLPGFTEALQYAVLKKLGLTEIDSQNLPSGNPNLIREAKRRDTVKKGDAGSGLKATISIKMAVEYEQKFIAGTDPTITWMNTIANALNFGTSDARFQFTGKLGDGIKSVLEKLSKGDVEGAVREFLNELIDAIEKVGKSVINELIKGFEGSNNEESDPDELGQSDFENILGTFITAAREVVSGIVSKYKVRIIGIINAVTGQPSTPWHVTIGNPKKPILCSGDMYVDDVTLTLGPTLAFNDLPSSLKIEFTLTNARSLGKQEIFRKLNTGKGRSYESTSDIFAKNLLVVGTKTPDPNASIDAPSQNATITNSSTGRVSTIGNNPADGNSTLAGTDVSNIGSGNVIANQSNASNEILNASTAQYQSVNSGNSLSTVFDETENGGTVTFVPKPNTN